VLQLPTTQSRVIHRLHVFGSVRRYVLTSKALIYGSEIGAWLTNGSPAVDPASGIPARTTTAAIPIIRYAVSDCFTGMTCGSDKHAGTMSRASFDQAVQGMRIQ